MTAALPQWHGPGGESGQRLGSVAHIVIPLDERPDSRLALPIARRLAQLYNATPHLLYVGRGTGDAKEILRALGLTPEDISGAVLDERPGNFTDAIIRMARELPNPVVVMSAEGESQSNESFGQVAEAVLESSPARVVLAAPAHCDRNWQVRRILLAHDGTWNSDSATAPAAELAQRASAEVIALHVAARKAASPQEPGSLPAPRYLDQPQHEWPAWTQEFMDRMLALGAPPSAVHFDLVVAGGQPGSEIAELAQRREVDLVVMAWNGKWNHTRHAATRAVIRACGCPVMLVRSEKET